MRLRCGYLVLLTVATILARPAGAQSNAPIAPKSPGPAPPSGQEALLRPGQSGNVAGQAGNPPATA